MFGRLIVEHLNFHPGVSRIALHRRANPDAVVGARLELEIEAQNEIGKFPFGQQIPAAARGAINNAIGHSIAIALLINQLPAVKAFAVEQRSKPNVRSRGEGRATESQAANPNQSVSEENVSGRMIHRRLAFEIFEVLSI